jgi:hypothetical protein
MTKLIYIYIFITAWILSGVIGWYLLWRKGHIRRSGNIWGRFGTITDAMTAGCFGPLILTFGILEKYVGEDNDKNLNNDVENKKET